MKFNPSPTDLIVKFLSIAPDTKEAESKQSENEPSENSKNEALGSKRRYKYLALKILALKVAAFLKWDLTLLERSDWLERLF
ncbi:integrator complex subunit 8-like isoform X2 [Cryptotermes secundus]|uniref:integrator complex subunit 8-like isoform X2 n=1 Tax=Cryptotermes secundus TaxID=105785 RepID=UPI001454CAFB|nr:integrator complex subunit 8-like isoform X2 [Cryptotermes secundus]